MPDLERFSLGETRLSDAVIARLLGMPKLTYIDIQKTRVSANGYAALKAAFPKADILWSEPNRTAAEAVLALGCTVAIRVKGQKDDRLVKSAADLPGEYFQLARANLGGMQKSLDIWVPNLAALTDAEFDHVAALDLAGTAITDADLAKLAGLTALTELSLARTKVSDAGLIHLQALTALRRLDLDGTPLRSLGVRGLKDLPKLTELRLGCPTLTDLFLPQLGELKQLERLSLANSQITDDGLKHLSGLSALRELDLSNTLVTAVGAAALAKALPECKVIRGIP
jgi:hypothetical protein